MEVKSMKVSVLYDVTIKDQNKYVVGYSKFRKNGCEIFNFVSPTLRILRFIEGSAQWKIDGIVQCFCHGDIIILNNLNKRNIHKLLSEYITYEMFDFYPSFLSNDQLWTIFYFNVHKIVSTSDEKSNKINFLLDCLREEILCSADTYQIFSIQRLLDLLALEFRRNINLKNDVHYNESFFNIAKSVRYISEHFCENLTILSLAQQCNYSAEYYSRIFKKYLGVSPIQYIIGLRLENVLQLIRTENMTVLDAAYQSGFQSSSAFYKAFRTHYETSPTKYAEAYHQLFD